MRSFSLHRSPPTKFLKASHSKHHNDYVDTPSGTSLFRTRFIFPKLRLYPKCKGSVMRSFILVALLGILFSISTQQNCSASLTFSFNATITQNEFGGPAVGSNYQFSFTTASNFTSTGQTDNFGLFADQPGNLVFTNVSGAGLTGAISESSLDGTVAPRHNQTGFSAIFVADDSVDMGFSFQGTPLFFFNIGFTGSGIVNPVVPGATLENTFNTGTFLNTGSLAVGDAGITALVEVLPLLQK